MIFINNYLYNHCKFTKMNPSLTKGVRIDPFIAKKDESLYKYFAPSMCLNFIIF